MEEMKILKELFGVAKIVHDLWEKIPRTEILNQETTINVPEATIDYSIAVKIPANLRILRSTIPIPISNILRMSVSTLSPLPRTIRGSTQRSLDGNGYVFFPNKIPSDAEIISMSVNYPIDNMLLLEDFVETNNTHDPKGPDRNEYWFHALLKHPKVLEDQFGRFDIRDVDVTVDVAVQEDLKTHIPRSYIERLKTFFEVFTETNPREQWRVMFTSLPKLRRLTRGRTAGSELELLNSLQALFLPRSFSRFVDVLKDFRYSECYKGKESYELPIELIPKKMEVVSRADLTLEKPAAEGILVYKQENFRSALDELFGNK